MIHFLLSRNYSLLPEYPLDLNWFGRLYYVDEHSPFPVKCLTYLKKSKGISKMALQEYLYLDWIELVLLLCPANLYYPIRTHIF